MNATLRVIVLGALSGCVLFGQDLTGTWQGTLLQAGQPPKDLRIVVKISKAEKVSKIDDALNVVFYSIDQGRLAFTGSINLQGSAVKITVPGVGGTYEGKMDSDGVSMAGTWTQGANPLPLNLKHVTSETAWAIPEPPARLKPMAADADPAFEVATIKPSQPETQGKGIRITGRRFTTIHTSLSDLMTFAYGLHPRQISGAPAWIETEHYDLAAQPDGEGQPNDKQWKMMLQKLLAARFKLTIHRDKKELSVYAIAVAKTGPKLTKSQGDPDGLPGMFFRALGALTVRNATMMDFAGLMQSAVLDRPVMDQTGVAGRWDFTLTWTPDEFQFAGLGIKPPPQSADAAAPDLFTAFQEQLGLRLESTKAQAEILLVDHVEKPSEN